MVELLDSKEIHSIESRMIALLDRTFLKSTKLDSVDYKKELPKNVKRWFGSKTFGIQLNNLITELIKFSLLYADGQMKILTAAKVEEGTILTKEAIARATDISENAAKSIIKMLEDDAIYYEGPAKLGRRIEDLWQGQRSQAVSFAHTFSADVATGTTVYRYRQYGVQFMEFSAKLDDRTTPQCRCLHGTVFDLSKDSVDKYHAPLHHRCRSALLPIPNTREPQKDMIFENRDFSGTLDDPNAVKRVFDDIDKFNSKYRVSGYVIDKDLSTRIMMEKGAYVSVVSDIPVSQLVTKEVVEDVATKTAFVPAKTVKEAEEWAKKYTDVQTIDYTGLDVKTANALNDALTRHLELDPKVASKMKYYGTAQGQSTIQYKIRYDSYVDRAKKLGYSEEDAIKMAKIVKKEKTPVNVMAYYKPSGDIANGIGFNKNMGKYFDKLEEAIQRDVEAGFHPIGCGTVKATIDHEFGHVLDDIYQISKSSEVKKIFIQANADYINKGLSRYALTSPEEFVAEAWTEYLNNPAPREISKKIGDLMMSKIKGGGV